MQLEEELSLRRAEVETLQVQLRGSDSTSQQINNGDVAPGDAILQELSASGDMDISKLKEKYNSVFAASQREIDSLKALVDKQNQEICESKQKVQQATKENMDMMDSWKVFVYSLF